MAVSVRMNPLLEKELELAASRLGVTKDPAQLYHQVMEEAARYQVGEGAADADLSPHQAALRQSLRGAYVQQQDDYAAYLAERGKP